MKDKTLYNTDYTGYGFRSKKRMYSNEVYHDLPTQ